MGLLQYSAVLRNGQTITHTDLNNNFTNISNLVNGNLDGDNFSPSAELACNSLTAAIVYAKRFTANSTLTIKLPSTDGSHSFSIKSAQGNELLKVASDGRVTFRGYVPQLPVGTILMYNGTGIANADSRSIDLSELDMYGWYVANGQSATPDLRGQFLFGSTVSGATGGSDNATIPQHSHTGSSANNSVTHNHTTTPTCGSNSLTGHSHTIDTYGKGSPYNTSPWGAASNISVATITTSSVDGGEHTHTFSLTSGNNSATHTHTVTIDNYTSSGTGKNVPPYYSLIMIKRMV
jgi:hypothetical protein